MKYIKYLVSIITALSISSVVSANEIKMGATKLIGTQAISKLKSTRQL